MRVISAIVFTVIIILELMSLAEVNAFDVHKQIFFGFIILITLGVGFLVTYSIPQKQKVVIVKEDDHLEEDEEDDE